VIVFCHYESKLEVKLGQPEEGLLAVKCVQS